jgi:hypothetical protein
VLRTGPSGAKSRPFTRRGVSGQHDPDAAHWLVGASFELVNLRGLALIAAGLLVASCLAPAPRDATVDSDAADDANPPGVTVAVGTGQSDFVDLPPTGGTIEIVYGPQGGYHVWGRARFRGFAPDVDVAFQVTQLDDGRILHSPLPLHRWVENGVLRGLVDLGGGEFMTNAEQVVLNIACSTDLVGRHILLELWVTERASGRVAYDHRDVRVVDNDPSPPCRGP